MEKTNYTTNYISSKFSNRVKNALFLLVLAIALGLGLSLVSPAHGAELRQTAQGTISGAVTVRERSAPGMAVELRQRSNSGADISLAKATTDSTGTYRFSNQPSAPSDAFYYVRVAGGKDTLTMWNTFPIIYINGSDFTVPGVEMGDIELVAPTQGAVVAPSSSLQWKARRSGETYRLYIYADGKADKAVLDSGSLGMGTQFSLENSDLAEGKYDAIVQVRDAVVGYGQSHSSFRFIIGKAPAPAAGPGQGLQQPGQSIPAAVPTAQTQSAGTPSSQTGGTQPAQPAQATRQPAETKADLQVDLSADKISVGPGGRLVYTIQITNKGGATAAGVVVTDRLPAATAADAAHAGSTSGDVSISGNLVTVQVGDVAPQAKVTVQIPVQVSTAALNNISNQASAAFQGSSDAVQSNSYVAEVAAPATGPSQQATPQPTTQAVASSTPQPSVAPPTAAPVDTATAQPQATEVGTVAVPTSPAATAPVPATATSIPPTAVAAQPHATATTPASGSGGAGTGSGTGSGTGNGVGVTPKATAKATSTVQKPSSATMPQTGGQFPVLLAVVLVIFTLLARYLRGRNYRRV